MNQIFKFLLLFKVFSSIQCEQGFNNNNPTIVPDIFSIQNHQAKTIVGYKIYWEIDLLPTTRTVSLTEYYDIRTGTGRLEYRSNSSLINDTFIYFGNFTGETFTLSSRVCTLGDISQRPKFLADVIDDYTAQGYVIKKRIMGPSAYLRIIDQPSKTIQYDGPIKALDRRYFSAKQWSGTYGGNRFIKWIFTDPARSPYPYGYVNDGIPISVSIGATEDGGIPMINKNYEIAQFIPYFDETPAHYEFLEVLKIPMGVGCQRNAKALATTKNVKPPSLNGSYSYDMKLEVVMNPSYKSRGGSDWSMSNLVDNGRITYDFVSQMYSFSYDGFNSTGNIQITYHDEDLYDSNNQVIDNGPLKGNELKDPTRSVWDVRAGIVYVVDDESGGCVIKKKGTNDFLVSINFKRGYRISIARNEFFHTEGFTYLGESIERGIPCIVFEKTIPKMLLGFGNSFVNRDVIITHYFVRDDYSNNYIANNMFIKIVVTVRKQYEVHTGSQTTTMASDWSAVINVNEFTVKVPKIDVWSHIKQQMFNIRNCYLSDSLSKWFQIGFPLTPRQYSRINGDANTLDKQILSYLFTDSDLLIPPTRIPKSLIGWKQNTLYFNALLIERAPYNMDFTLISKAPKKLKLIGSQFVVRSAQTCYQRCLDLDTNCNYFSICDDFMCLLGNPSLSLTAVPVMVASSTCNTYKKIQKPYKTYTMNYFLNKLRNKVRLEKNIGPIKPLALDITYENSTGFLESIRITGVEFKSGFTLGQTNSFDGHLILRKDKYQMKATTHFKSSTPAQSSVMVNSFLKCQQKCDDFGNNSCHSFSYCTTSKECILSTLHAEDIIDSTNSQQWETKADCALLYRTYISEYERILDTYMTPKTAVQQSTASNVEECALICTNNKQISCKSFEFCFSIGKAITQNCFLHTNHNIDTKIKEKLTLNLNASAVRCGHYSRYYVTDYNVKSSANYAVINGAKRIEMRGLTTEQCARQCSQSQTKEKCLGFAFCQNRYIDSTAPQPICWLSGANDQQNTVFYSEDKDCQIFYNGSVVFSKSIANSTEAPITVVKQHQKSESSSGGKRYSSGAGAGTGIFMLLLGAFLTVVAIIVYERRKAASR